MITLRQAVELTISAIEEGVSFDHLDNVTAPMLRRALAEPNTCTHGVTDGNCKECYMAELEQEPVFDCPRCGHCCPQTEQEPFAYCYVRKGISVDILTFDDNPKDAVSGTVFPLYTAPPQRKPLTDDFILNEVLALGTAEFTTICGPREILSFARAIEAAHGIKGKA